MGHDFRVSETAWGDPASLNNCNLRHTFGALTTALGSAGANGD
jgi:hypothetical protein